jgi:deoxyribonuclease V
MIAAVDVHYDETRRRGRAAAVIFGAWEDGESVGEYVAEVENVADYVPGEFYRRELPCLMAVIGKIGLKVDLAVVDGYVRVKDKPGLGEYLFDALGGKIVVVGVAKTLFVGAPGREVLRGGSKSPLYVSAVGMDVADAAKCIARMHGGHQIPTMLKRVDRLARGGGASSVTR